MPKAIINFNHISDSLTVEQRKLLMNLYATYHRKGWCYRKAYLRYKYFLVVIHASSIAISSSGVLTTGITLNPIFISITGVGIIMQGLFTRLEYKLQQKKAMCKFGYASYAKVLNNLKGYLRGNEYEEGKLLTDLTNIDNILVDITPMVDRFEKEYTEKYK